MLDLGFQVLVMGVQSVLVGHREKLAAYAQKLDLSWLKGQGRALGYS